MSYLLIQILVCLLIAGLIGVVIGWLIRGGCTKKLANRDLEWNVKLNKNKADFENITMNLMSENDSKISTLSDELSTTKERLNIAQIESKEAKHKFVSHGKEWISKFENLQKNYELQNEDLSKKLSSSKVNIDKLETTLASTEFETRFLDNKIKKLSDSYDKNINTANQEYDLVKKQLELSKNEVVDLKDKMINSENEWKLRLRNLQKDSEIRDASISKKLSMTENQLEIAKTEIEKFKNSAVEIEKEWNKKLENLQKNSENRLINNDNQWIQKLQKIIDSK